MISKTTLLLACVFLINFSANAAVLQQVPDSATIQAPKVPCKVKKGDKAVSKFDYNKSLGLYQKALSKSGKYDTLQIIQRIADTYRLLGQTGNAEMWYKKIADKNLDSKNLFYYAEALRANQNFSLAKQYYQKYKAAVPGDKNADEAIAGLENLPELLKDKGVFRVNIAGISSAGSEYGPAFYRDGQIFVVSNNNKKNVTVTEKWNAYNFYKVYTASPDSATYHLAKVKKLSGCKPKGRFHDGPVTYSKQTDELVFGRSSKIKNSEGSKVVNQKLYLVKYSDGKRKVVSLPFNSNDYSSAHPALSPDGKTLFFSSDKLGGFGGADLYVTTQDQTGNWIEPQNLGPKINTAHDEKYPSVAYDGTLYFSSNSLQGLGGLDVYRSKQEAGVWSTPENLGAPVNSNKDDYTFVMDSTNRFGYFASNREGGMGSDDIYRFTYDETKLDYKVTVRVIDANTSKPIDMVTLALECNNTPAENSLTDTKGEKVFVIKGGKTCSVDAGKTGYKNSIGQITPKNKNGVVVVQLRPDVIKLAIVVKEKENTLPVRDAAVSVTPAGKAPMNYSTNENGVLEAEIPSGNYTITSPDFPSINTKFSDADADPNTGQVKFDFMIPRNEIIVNVPLTANCFSSTVSVTDLKDGYTSEVSPNTNGEVRLDLRINNRYLITHNGRTDTISTIGVEPGGTVDGPCKFFVGQTWIIRNIYYDLNKWNIRPDAAQELDNLIHVMKDNPSLEIELSSHTDCRSSARYNNILSARRAKSAVDYIMKKGVKAKRIIAAGYGETQLVNGCVCEPGNESNCTDEQHQANRRTEVKVLRY